MGRPWGRIVLETAALALASALIGWISAEVRQPSIPWRLPDAFFRVESGARPLLLAQARARLEAGGLVLVDTRDEPAFRAGHLPGALSLPAANWEGLLAAASPWLQGAPILLYDTARNVNGADLVAAALRREGFGPLFVLVEGFESWQGAGLPVDLGDAGRLDPEVSPFDDETDPFEDGEDDLETGEVEEGAEP